jgi:hypothetical protein
MIEERKEEKRDNTALKQHMYKMLISKHLPVKYLPRKAFSTAEEQQFNSTTKCNVRYLQINKIRNKKF